MIQKKLKALRVGEYRLTTEPEEPKYKSLVSFGPKIDPINFYFNDNSVYLGFKLTGNQSLLNFFQTNQAKFNDATLFTNEFWNVGAILANQSTPAQLIKGEDISLAGKRSENPWFLLATILGFRETFVEIDGDFDINYGDNAIELGLDFATKSIKNNFTNNYELINTPGELFELNVIVFENINFHMAFKTWKKDVNEETVLEFLNQIKPDIIGGYTNAFVLVSMVIEKIK